MLNRLIRFVLAVVICSVIISIGSTQIVLASVASFGLDIDLTTRITSTLRDIAGFGPILILVVTVAYLLGFIVAYLLSKILLNHYIWGIIAGLTAVPTAIILMNYVLDLEILFMTSVVAGWLVLIAASLIGSLIFHRQASRT